MTEFLRDIEELFDVFCNDQKQQRKLEEINKLKMNEDDFAFYVQGFQKVIIYF